MSKVLIVVDAQEDFTRGALRNEEAIKALPTVHNVIRYAEDHDFDIYCTMDTHFKSELSNYLDTQEGKNLPIEHCIYQTNGWKLCKEVQGEKSHCPILKETFGYLDWRDEELDPDEIWICGFCTDICVSANFQILKATFPEVPITIIEDACAGVTPELHDAAIKVMKSCQAHVVKFNELI